MIRSSRRAALAVAIAATAWLTAGCGSKADSTEAPTTTAAEQTGTGDVETETAEGWFTDTRARDDYQEFVSVGQATVGLIIDAEVGSEDCAAITTAVEGFRLNLPSPDPTLDTNLQVQFDAIETGVAYCESAALDATITGTFTSRSGEAFQMLETSIARIQQALVDAGVPVQVTFTDHNA